jgi:hypothetical protein
MTLKTDDPERAERVAFTVNEFCFANRISRQHLYDLWAEGHGPRFIRAGEKTLISVEDAAAWRTRGESAPPIRFHGKRGGNRRGGKVA